MTTKQQQTQVCKSNKDGMIVLKFDPYGDGRCSKKSVEYNKCQWNITVEQCHNNGGII